MRAYLTYAGVAVMAALTLMAAGASHAAAGNARLGRQKAAMCKTCHGLDGIAKQPNAPNIGGESEIYLVTQLKAFRSGKRQHEIMSVIAVQLSDDDIANLSAWYASIKITATLPAD